MQNANDTPNVTNAGADTTTAPGQQLPLTNDGEDGKLPPKPAKRKAKESLCKTAQKVRACTVYISDAGVDVEKVHEYITNETTADKNNVSPFVFSRTSDIVDRSRFVPFASANQSYVQHIGKGSVIPLGASFVDTVACQKLLSSEFLVSCPYEAFVAQVQLTRSVDMTKHTLAALNPHKDLGSCSNSDCVEQFLASTYQGPPCISFAAEMLARGYDWCYRRHKGLVSSVMTPGRIMAGAFDMEGPSCAFSLAGHSTPPHINMDAVCDLYASRLSSLPAHRMTTSACKNFISALTRSFLLGIKHVAAADVLKYDNTDKLRSFVATYMNVMGVTKPKKENIDMSVTRFIECTDEWVLESKRSVTEEILKILNQCLERHHKKTDKGNADVQDQPTPEPAAPASTTETTEITATGTNEDESPEDGFLSDVEVE